MKQAVQVVTATLLVAGCPVAVVWWLRASHTVSSPVIGVILGMALSLFASQVGRVLWEKRPGSEDLLFSELMLWGFLHRWHSQRRLASARELLGPLSGAQTGARDGLSTKRQASLLEQLVAGMETRDPYLHGHSRRVARHSWMIARRMGLSREEVARVRTAAAIHDVGKIETPTVILHKKGPLSEEEYGVIKRHPGDGARMAAALRDGELTAIVGHHHERLDGSGYPSGLAGEEIPLGARIVAVADTFDAITSARPYRLAGSHKKAIDILKAEAGTKLDPAVVRAFCAHYAGRRPIVLWGSVTSLPERALSWLSSGVGSVASAAKLLAVTALVGGTAATTSTLALPASSHPRSARATSTDGPHAASSGLFAAPRAPGNPSVAISRRPGMHLLRAKVRGRVSTPKRVGAGGSAPVSLQRAAPVSRAGSGQRSATGTGEARAPKAQSEGGPAASQEAPARVTVKESAGRGGEASGNAPTTVQPGKSAEAPGQTSEASPGKSGEAPGGAQSGESLGRSGEVVAPSKTNERAAKGSETPGSSSTVESAGEG